MSAPVSQQWDCAGHSLWEPDPVGNSSELAAGQKKMGGGQGSWDIGNDSGGEWDPKPGPARVWDLETRKEVVGNANAQTDANEWDTVGAGRAVPTKDFGEDLGNLNAISSNISASKVACGPTSSSSAFGIQAERVQNERDPTTIINAAIETENDGSAWNNAPSSNAFKETGATHNIWDPSADLATGKPPGAEQEGRGTPTRELLKWEGPAESTVTKERTGSLWGSTQLHRRIEAPQEEWDVRPKRNGFGFAPHVRYRAGDDQYRGGNEGFENRRGGFRNQGFRNGGVGVGSRHQEEHDYVSSYDMGNEGNSRSQGRFGAFESGDARRYSDIGQESSVPQTPICENNFDHSSPFEIQQQRHTRLPNFGHNVNNFRFQTQPANTSSQKNAKGPQVQPRQTSTTPTTYPSSEPLENQIPTRRSLQRCSNTHDLRCHDWMITDNGHHYTKEITFFAPRTYLLPPPSVHAPTVAGHAIHGIGSISLQVRRSPLDRELHTLVLKNVLHIPSAPCNGFDPGLLGQQCTEQNGIVKGTASRGREVWYADLFCGSPRLVLPGVPKGVSGLKGSWWMGSMYPTDTEVRELEEWLELLRA